MTNPNVRPELEALKVLLSKATSNPPHAISGSQVYNNWRSEAVQAEQELYETLPDLIAHIERLQNALKPFATFADTFVDADGWSGPMNVERIVDWFGPSDFREARATLSQGTSNE